MGNGRTLTRVIDVAHAFARENKNLSVSATYQGDRCTIEVYDVIYSRGHSDKKVIGRAIVSDEGICFDDGQNSLFREYFQRRGIIGS